MKAWITFKGLGDLVSSVKCQLTAAVVVPLNSQNTVNADPRSQRRVDICEDAPGRICRNGYGSLEVGGLRDRWEE
ncbi:MAG: hypothetical protein INH43_06810 [Acidobacteriaceae bacterium]|nr:hypothetical protein [Acidobacteriaceae bacterium]